MKERVDRHEAAVGEVVDVGRLYDRAADQVIRDRGIDILVNLDGYRGVDLARLVVQNF